MFIFVMLIFSDSLLFLRNTVEENPDNYQRGHGFQGIHEVTWLETFVSHSSTSESQTKQKFYDVINTPFQNNTWLLLYLII